MVYLYSADFGYTVSYDTDTVIKARFFRIS